MFKLLTYPELFRKGAPSGYASIQGKIAVILFFVTEHYLTSHIAEKRRYVKSKRYGAFKSSLSKRKYALRHGPGEEATVHVMYAGAKCKACASASLRVAEYSLFAGSVLCPEREK